MRGEVELALRRDLLVTRKVRESKKTKPKDLFVADVDQDLWEALRERRKRFADENNVPPYVIFHDTTLVQIAATKPQTSEAFLAINGVGQTKLARYGPAFLEVVRLANA